MPDDIENLRRQARRLKKSYAADKPDSRERVHNVLGAGATPRHADFLHVIAVEYGHQSWPKLKFALEQAAMTRDQRVTRLLQALYFGQHWVTKRLLAEDPGLASEDYRLQLALYDLEAVLRRIEADRAAATRPLGMRTPLLHLACSRYIHMAPDKRSDMMRIADELRKNGADVNDSWPAEPGSEHRLSALYGALGHADNLALAEWLLEHGANPDDNESLYHATELGHHDGLKLLLRHNVSTRGTNALLRALDFDDYEAVRLLLEHGADPNEEVPDHPSGQPVPSVSALHHAALRHCSGRIADLLLDHGARPDVIRNGHSTYALARIVGNRDFAAALEHRGHASPLTDVEKILVACADGGDVPAQIDPGNLQTDDRRLLVDLIRLPVPLDHLKALVAAGLDPGQTDAMELTALHAACWEGLPERVAWLLEFDPDLTWKNAYGGDALSTTVHGSEFCPEARERDHIACADLLLAAGALLDPSLADECGNQQMALFLESRALDLNV